MIIFVAAAIYLPGFFIHPQYNFLYSTSSDYYGTQLFTIKNGKLVKEAVKWSDGQKYVAGDIRLFIHDVASNKSQAFLIWGTIFLMVYLLKITSEYFSKGFGWPLALVMLGLSLIGVGYMSISIKRKFLSV